MTSCEETTFFGVCPTFQCWKNTCRWQKGNLWRKSWRVSFVSSGPLSSPRLAASTAVSPRASLPHGVSFRSFHQHHFVCCSSFWFWLCHSFNSESDCICNIVFLFFFKQPWFMGTSMTSTSLSYPMITVVTGSAASWTLTTYTWPVPSTSSPSASCIWCWSTLIPWWWVGWFWRAGRLFFLLTRLRKTVSMCWSCPASASRVY